MLESWSRCSQTQNAVREVYDEVQEATDGKPTAAAYREAVERRLGALPTSERHAAVLQAIEAAQPLLAEPEHEKALYALSRVAFWLYLEPATVADASAAPAQDAASYAELAAWVGAVAVAIRARADGLRLVR